MERLPAEVLSSIVAWVPKESLVVCMLVCRHWHAASRRKLYEAVKIHSRRQFKRFIWSIEQSSVHGKLVRTLDMAPGLSQTELEMLTSLLPNLRELCMSSDAWRHLAYTDKLKDWKNLTAAPTFSNIKMFTMFFHAMGSHLTRLQLEPPISDHLCSNDRIFKVLTGMPCLEQLNLQCTKMYDQLPEDGGTDGQLHLTLDWLASLHRVAAHLKSLSLSDVIFLPASASGMAAANDFEFEKMQSLDLEGCICDFAWIEDHIPRLFNNIENLQAEIRLGVDEPNLQHKIADATFTLLARSTNLRRVWYHWSTQLPQLRLDSIIPDLIALGRRYDDITLDSLSFRSLAPLLNPETTTSAVVVAWEPLDVTFRLLQHFKCLTELSLDVNSLLYTLHIDLILDCLRKLEVLSLIRANSIDCREYSGRSKYRHPLSCLEIMEAGLKSRAISYVAQRCLDLEELLMTEVYMEEDQEEGCLTLNFPSQTFNSIALDQIYRSPTGKYVPEDLFEEFSGVQLIAISQIKRIQKKVSRLQSRCQSPDAVKAVRKERIYYAEDDLEQSFLYQNIFHLSDLVLQDLKTVIPREEWENEDASNWKKSLEYGFIHFICQDVKKVQFNGAQELIYY